ncbi:type II restriction endonuclease subunit M [Caballeronia sp. EK]|uniref:type II restriction endonuclease subunit M n=1 Tax=Caballeronia sp. EK TaxID=2767469 RepID=UPI0016551A4B|nr:type II restriction endonuclease subunit M [Caballeronia sp. EK]MBC8641181.1 type II restriction endonuclease subunit M [Caballeronia sp. EK]
MTTFLNLLSEPDKQAALAGAVKHGGRQVIRFDPADFCKIPGSPFAYWVSGRVLEAYEGQKYDDEDHGRGTRCGLGTLDDFRFIRLFWEPKARGDVWVTYFHGGVFSRFYDNFPLIVNWYDSGKEIKTFVESKVGSASRKVQGEDKYFQPGFVFPRRTKGFSPKFMPRGGIFSTGGQAGFAPPEELAQTVGLLASQACTFLISLSQGRTGDAAQFEVGLVKRLPWPPFQKFEKQLATLAYRSWSLRRTLDTTEETSAAYLLPGVLRSRLGEFDTCAIESELEEIQDELDKIALQLYALEETDCALINQQIAASHDVTGEDDAAEEEGSDIDDGNQAGASATDALLSWAVGVVFGRFDWRLATGDRQVPREPDPFDPLPDKSPGMLPEGTAPFLSHDGILVDDKGHPHDVSHLVEEVLLRVDVAVPDNIRRWLQRDFFAFHLQRYSKSRRKAPVYWPLSTVSGSYTLWVYYPRLSSETLYAAVNDFVEPKVKDVGEQVAALRNKAAARTREDEKQFEILQAFELELIEMRDTLLELASTYRPNHDDGVQISAAPLWPLFRHKSWQKLLKDTWAKLAKGDYDWAHLSRNYWPDRVREKCKLDRSLAIAHDLEELYVEPEANPKKTRGRKKADT